MIGSRSALGVKLLPIARLGKPAFKSSIRALSVVPPGGDEGQKSYGKKRGAFAIGTVVAAGGMAYAYKVFTNDKYDPMDSIKWASQQIGLIPEPVTAEPVVVVKLETKGGRSALSDTAANCAGKEKDDCGGDSKCADSACLHKMDKEEEMIAKANSDLEKALKDVKPKAMEATEAALKAYCEAIDAVKLFMDKAYCAIEEDNLDSPRFEEVWCEVYETAVKRCEKVKDAVQKGQCAWELLCKLREIIENGKNCKYTSCNPLLITAEETLLCAERELLNAKAKMDCVQSESRLVEQYKNLIEDFRRDVKAEMESMLTTNPECRTNLTENECNMVLTHAYKKVLRVQKELAIVQAKGLSNDLARNLDIPEAQQELEEIKMFYEDELIRTLARQGQVHHETLELSRNALRQEYERRLRQNADIVESEHLVDLRTKYTQASTALAAMREVLSERKEQDERSEELRKLWTYCSNIYNKINYATTSDSVVSIRKEQLLKEFSGDDFAVELIKTIPDSIDSIEYLRNRFFNKIDKTCRNVGVFRAGENVSVGKYFWGYIQGALTTRCEGSQESGSTIYEILDKTAFHLRRGELLHAVLELNRTEGPARMVCKDWLSDARAVLEASQTLVALMTHANAENHCLL